MKPDQIRNEFRVEISKFGASPALKRQARPGPCLGHAKISIQVL